MPGPVYPSGERVDLRVTGREDVKFLQRARSDPDLRTPLTFTEPQTREQVEAFYESTISADNGDANFPICKSGSDDSIGEVSLFRTEHDHAEIAYWLLSESRARATRPKPSRCCSTTPSRRGDSTARTPRRSISTTVRARY